MGAVKKVLVIVQGINKKREYMIPSMPIIESFFGKYAVKEYVHTEDVFDGTITSKFVDKADFIPYFFNKKKRLQVCRMVNETISKYIEKGYEVDVLSHSLGTIIALQCGRKVNPIKFNKLISLQSPIHNWIYGWYVRMSVRKYSDFLDVNHFITTWNKKDRLVAGGSLNIDRFVRGLKSTIKSWTQVMAGKGHDWELALKDLIIGGLV